MPCCSQYLVSRNVTQGIDSGERATCTMRGYELVSQLRLSRDNAVNLIINMHLVHEGLANVVQEFMQIGVVVVDVASIRCMVVVLLQDSEGDTAVDAQAVDGHKALVTRLLLNDGELTVAEILRTDANQVGIPLAEVASQDEHVAHSFQCLYLVPA